MQTFLTPSCFTLSRCILLLTFFLPVQIFALSAEISFSSKKIGASPQLTYETEFTCSDKIYILLQTQGLSIGIYNIELHWINPLNKRQELTKFDAYVSDDKQLIWAWLRLQAPSNSQVIRAFDPSFGMRNFIGLWRVKIHIDGKLLSTEKFDVLC